ncbi:hypothetical protein BRADI_2g12585v3, partial [Brachypodium distachyon]
MPTNKRSKRREESTNDGRPRINLMEYLVQDILLRLPVKSLVRFKSVSKAWRAIISDPLFTRTHLEHSVTKWKQNPSANKIRFYQWSPGSAAEGSRLVHGRDFRGEFGSVCNLAHCDGLVLLPTNTQVYLFNPATRDSLTLPQSSPSKIPCTPVGDTAASWRDTSSDPPYTITRWVTAKSVKGFMFWIVDTNYENEKLRPPCCILRFSLEDETFNDICLPHTLDPALDEPFMLDVINEDLCLVESSSTRSGLQPPVRIWMLVKDD